MVGSLRAACAFALIANSLSATEFQNLECSNLLTETFSDREKNFCENSYFSVFENGQYKTFDKVTCNLVNDITVHIYQENSKFVLESKGFENESSVEFSKCKNIPKAIEKISRSEKKLFREATQRNFLNTDSALIVASENSCITLGNSLSAWLQILKNEGREKSDILCIPSNIIATKNPSTIRKFIHQNIHEVSGLILAGNDIPPFEYFFERKYSDGFSSFQYGATDLAYGDLSSEFWTQPLSKFDEQLRNRVYHDEGYAQSTAEPTVWAFDLTTWLTAVREGRENPLDNKKLWVSRWIASENLQSSALHSFVSRRAQFKPFTEHRFIYARGGSGILFSPHDTEQKLRTENMLHPFIEALPNGSTSNIVTSAQLFGLSRNLDKNITFASYEEHGSSVGIGDLKANRLSEVKWLPPIFHVDSCSTGEWFSQELADTFMNQLMTIENPPLLVIASQGINWLPTIGTPDSVATDIFFNSFKTGQNFGNRQIETFQKNLQNWLINNATDDSPAFPSQLFLALSLFGDGTLEF